MASTPSGSRFLRTRRAPDAPQLPGTDYGIDFTLGLPQRPVVHGGSRAHAASFSSESPKGHIIRLPRTQDVILMHYRHINCLLASARYVAISHVWEPHVAEVQNSKAASEESAISVVHAIQEEPACIFRSLAQAVSGDFEVWHDYISVPQWIPELKSRIIRCIPNLFKGALMTVAYLADVDAGEFTAMRNGNSKEVRCRAISNLCNARWLSRVWTTMELTQSNDIRAMVRNYHLIERRSEYEPFYAEMASAWEDEVKRDGWARNLEELVGVGTGSLVPWQLGGVGSLRGHRLAGQRVSFAEAYQGLSRRRVTHLQDFFHALQGMLGTYVIDASNDRPQHIITEIARIRLSEGDLSPLFITPASAQTEVRHLEYGYLDLKTYGLGKEVSPPERPYVTFDTTSGLPRVQAQELGEIQFVRRYGWHFLGQIESLAELCRLTLDVTGLDIYMFAEMLCVRLYGQESDQVRNRLAEANRFQQLRERLTQLYNTKRHQYEKIVIEIGFILGLSNMSLGGGSFNCWNMTPMSFLQHHGGTIHHGPSAAIAGVRCRSCNTLSLLRIALFRPASSLLKLKAYRIPGLKYFFSHPGGAGFVLEEGKIMGRFVWAVPACACEKWAEVEVKLDLPLPDYMPARMDDITQE